MRRPRVTSGRTRINDDNAAVNIVPPGLLPHLSTHGTELPYLFDQPNAPVPGSLDAGQQALAASMRTAWSGFAASGSPSTRALPWPAFSAKGKVLSLVPGASAAGTDFAAEHHCSFWAAG